MSRSNASPNFVLGMAAFFAIKDSYSASFTIATQREMRIRHLRSARGTCHRHAAVEQKITRRPSTGMADAKGEHLKVHELILLSSKKSASGIPYFFLKTLSAWRA